ncbi:MAG TPA: hypothetical protein PK816_03865 [Candidatus Cloacimonadota bacterium]|jgi:hypothetical protein|nr:hypothetical protein [Candidatus Cloacimonadota bacterium]
MTTDHYLIFIEYLLWPVLLGIVCYLWKDLTSRVKSIENTSIRIEKDIVRISTLLGQSIESK